MDALHAVAKPHGLLVLEDAAQAAGARHRGRMRRLARRGRGLFVLSEQEPRRARGRRSGLHRRRTAGQPAASSAQPWPARQGRARRARLQRAARRPSGRAAARQARVPGRVERGPARPCRGLSGVAAREHRGHRGAPGDPVHLSPVPDSLRGPRLDARTSARGAGSRPACTTPARSTSTPPGRTTPSAMAMLPIAEAWAAEELSLPMHSRPDRGWRSSAPSARDRKSTIREDGAKVSATATVRTEDVPMVEPIGVAVVGLGYWGPNLLRVLADKPEAQVRWICDLDRERLEPFPPAPPVGAGHHPTSSGSSPTRASTRSSSPRPCTPTTTWRRRPYRRASTCSSRSRWPRRQRWPTTWPRMAAERGLLLDVRAHVPLQPARARDQADDRGRHARRHLLHLLQPGEPGPAPARRERDLGPGPA